MTDRKKDKERMKQNYHRLREAGFTSAEATRFRNASQEKIRVAIKTGKLPEKDPVRTAAGFGRKKETVSDQEIKQYQKAVEKWLGEVKPKPRRGVPPLPEGWYKVPEQKGEFIHENAANHPLMQYISNYTYVVAYVVKHKDGTKEWRVMTFTHDRKLTKAELLEMVEREFILPNTGRYDSKVMKSSYTVIGAYEKR
jgi:hypothetical protein